jgi:hypothetical protein
LKYNFEHEDKNEDKNIPARLQMRKSEEEQG